ncbi:hypothetical protein CSPX01_04318 [Colletotrichum filicis]|nr:hypothetical protein CSPX01_04318 [Colletotrichum filicis]
MRAINTSRIDCAIAVILNSAWQGSFFFFLLNTATDDFLVLPALSKLHRFDAQRSCLLSSTFTLILTVNLLFSQLSTQHDHYSKTWKTTACRNVNAPPSRKPKNNTFSAEVRV